MTDNEIIEALKWYKKLECGICYDVGILCHIGGGDCIVTLAETTLDLIRRQQAEIERLTANSKATESTLTKALKAIAYHETIDSYDGTENGDVVGTVCHDAYYVILGLKSRVKEARTEAIKEFAERLQENVTFHIDDCGEFVSYVDCRDIRNLVKEMVGAGDEN